MTEERPFRVRPGRVRSAKARRARTFLAVALAAAQKAGGVARGKGVPRSTFGRGRAASLAAARVLGSRARSAVIKARVVRRTTGSGALRAHIAYLERDGTTRDSRAGQLFGADDDAADGRAFAERCAGDRHHFRFVVSPDDAQDLASLKDFTRALMQDAERDLGTTLDWVAVDHWNTGHPHIHILMRGRDADGANLVISRDYISNGLRARAGALVTQELGPRSALEIRHGLEREAEAERWTRLDRLLAREAARADGIVDARPGADRDPLSPFRIARLRTLERLGFAHPAGPGQWALADDLEPSLRALGMRGDIIKRMHMALGDTRASADWVLEGTDARQPVIGRLAAFGLDDELRGTAYAIVDGIDGRAHHLTLPSIDAVGDAAAGAIVEHRHFTNAAGHERSALAVRSDWSIDKMIEADGATWLDRQLVSRQPIALGTSGFGDEVRRALEMRRATLLRMKLATLSGGAVRLRPDLIATLRGREVARVASAVSAETGLPCGLAQPGDPVSGSFQRRLSLASGRFAMIDTGLGFQLVPWTPSLERLRGAEVEGIAGPGGVNVARQRDRGPAL